MDYFAITEEEDKAFSTYMLQKGSKSSMKQEGEKC